jgi:hypothetical protein
MYPGRRPLGCGRACELRFGQPRCDMKDRQPLLHTKINPSRHR